jgi:hypothetical protein
MHVQKWNRTLRREEDIKDDVTGMNLIKTNNFYPFDQDSIKPLSLLQHKFIKISIDRNQAVAYEMCRALRRNTLSLELFRTVLNWNTLRQ